jgi:Carboxypeptidase regulatory-like domain/TonB dependent receptor
VSWTSFHRESVRLSSFFFIRHVIQGARRLLPFAAGYLLAVRQAGGQGMSGSAVRGKAVRASGVPAARATIRLINASNGSRRELRTDASGSFLFENVPPGGPYRIEAQAIGLPAARVPDFSLSLGQRQTVTIVFPGDSVRRLAPVIVAERPRDDDAGGAGGPAYSLPSEVVHGLPLLNRNFVGLFNMIPQSVGRASSSIGGQTPALNAIQIDGGTASDVYGVGGPTTGNAAGAKAISIEALDQIKVLVAPLDVRQAMFSGGLINAVTRSGTNQWRTEVFTSMQRPSLVGPDTAGARANGFEFLQYGATVGGPLVRDRLHLFVAADLQRSRKPFVGFGTTDTATGISSATAGRAAAAFRTLYGFDAGTEAAAVLTQPDQSVFAKVTWTVSPRHSVDLWHEEIRAHSDGFNRTANTAYRVGWELSNSGSTVTNSAGSSRLRISSLIGALTNELIAGDQSSVDTRASWLSTPLFLVQGDVSGKYLAGGSERNDQGTTLGQHTHEVTDNLSWRLRDHDLTAGAHAEWFRVADRIFQGSWGMWSFPSVDALEARAPTRYEVALSLRPDGPWARFRASTYSIYAQDRWAISSRLTITGGARLDVPFNSSPETNPVLAADTALGNPNTGQFPSGNALASPRLAASWLIDERTNTRLRLGAGVFTARPPYVWLGNAFHNTGLDQALLVCTLADGVPAPVIDLAHLPQQCVNPAPGRPPASSATLFSRDFRFPQVQKLLAGIDREIGRSWSASADVIRTRGVNAAFLTDVNLRQVGTDAEGRAMYGTISANGGRPTRLDSTSFTQILRYSNVGDDRSIAVSIGLNGHWDNGALVTLGYQWSRTRDIVGVGNPGAGLGFANEIIDGSISDRRLSTSSLDAPHNLTASGVVPLRGGVSMAFALRAQSGRPFSYVSNGDANADGVNTNDLFYVPRNAGDISLTNPALYSALDRYVESDPCLRSQRGRIVARNSCRNPAFSSLDARVTKAFAPHNTGPFDLTIDVFNVPNLIRGSWGLVRETSSKVQLGLLQVAGWDQAANRPLYTIPTPKTDSSVAVLPARASVLVDESRWRIQVGTRIRFGGLSPSVSGPTSAPRRESP